MPYKIYLLLTMFKSKTQNGFSFAVELSNDENGQDYVMYGSGLDVNGAEYTAAIVCDGHGEVITLLIT
jgi:hypothetical protein